MWLGSGTVRLSARHGRLLTRLTIARAASSGPPASLNQKHPVAKQLVATGLWNPVRRTRRHKEDQAKKEKSKRKEEPVAAGDKTRVNVVSESLCDDITKYIGPTLERHVGCDILDINPGVGLWSSRLHDVLKPRSHILMEPDADLYKPFLEPLLSKPGTRLVPNSGILWKELQEAMTFLEHQVEQDSTEPKRNDTLLVTANLSYYPRKKYRSFDSIAVLVLYQLFSSVRYSALFQKYGLVRMLLWVNDEDKRTVLPRSIQNRKRSALQAEFTSEWFAEVAGSDPASVDYPIEALKKLYLRDHGVDLASAMATLDRMKALGIKNPPKHRRMTLTQQAVRKVGNKTAAANLLEKVTVKKSRHAEMTTLQKAINAGEIEKYSEKWERFIALRDQMKKLEKDAKGHVALLGELRELRELHAAGKAGDAEFAEKEAAYNEKVQGLGKNMAIDYRLIRDNLHLFQQDPPVLLYDRRPWEPLRVEADEFFPNTNCALLDIQPKAVNPLLRDAGPGSKRAGDIFDLIQRSMLSSSLEPVSSALDKLWPCAGEGIYEHCPSLKNPADGGEPGSGPAEVCPRALNEKQWMEILGAFMKWPFRPTYPELIARHGDDQSITEGESAPIDTGI